MKRLNPEQPRCALQRRARAEEVSLRTNRKRPRPLQGAQEVAA